MHESRGIQEPGGWRITCRNHQILQVLATSLSIVTPQMKAVQAYILVVRMEPCAHLSNRHQWRKETLLRADFKTGRRGTGSGRSLHPDHYIGQPPIHNGGLRGALPIAGFCASIASCLLLG